MKLTGNYLLAFAALGYRTVEHLTESNVSGTSLAPLMLSTSRLIVNPHFEFAAILNMGQRQQKKARKEGVCAGGQREIKTMDLCGGLQMKRENNANRDGKRYFAVVLSTASLDCEIIHECGLFSAL